MSSTTGDRLFSRFFNGRVIRPSDSDYDARRELFNSRFDKKPALIAMCAGTSDVVTAIRHAREYDLEIAVRCGGRHMAGFAGTEGGLVIDLSEMNAVRVDPVEQTAWVQGGLTGGALHPETATHGLSGVTGMLSHVGIGGALLHGGMGYMSPRLGFGSDTLIAAEVVLADGAVRMVDDSSDPELMWALRGAGSNFGVVTWMKIRLASTPDVATSGYVFYRGADAAEAIRGIREVEPAFGDDVQWYANMFHSPADPSMPEELHDQPALLLALGHIGDVEKATRDIELVKSIGKPVATAIEQKAFIELNGADDALYNRGRQWWDDIRVASLGDDVIDLFVDSSNDMFATGLTGFDYNSLYGLCGAMRRPATVPSCLPRGGRYAVESMLFWDAPEDDEKHEAWSNRTVKAFHDKGLVTTDAYFNCVQAVDQDRLRRTFGEESWGRLVQLKKSLDAENVFHLNHNISPDAL